MAGAAKGVAELDSREATIATDGEDAAENASSVGELGTEVASEVRNSVTKFVGELDISAEAATTLVSIGAKGVDEIGAKGVDEIESSEGVSQSNSGAGRAERSGGVSVVNDSPVSAAQAVMFQQAKEADEAAGAAEAAAVQVALPGYVRWLMCGCEGEEACGYAEEGSRGTCWC